MEDKLRKFLQTQELVRIAKDSFAKILEPASKKNGCIRTISLTDCLMSGLAIFGLKSPSLLEFDTKVRSKGETVSENVRQLYLIEKIPSDTYMRERLDVVNPTNLRKSFTNIFAQAQRGKVLESFKYLGHYIVSVDGTAAFSSDAVHCDNCCKREHSDGKVTYYHQLLCAAIVNPHQKAVISFAPEFIMKNDGATKNDCEYNACLRFAENLRREHPHLPVIFTTDSLTSRAPIIRDYKQKNIRFVVGVKPGSHSYLFELAVPVCRAIERTGKDGVKQEYRYANSMPLNAANPDLLVNFLHYTEIDKRGKKTVFSWATDFELTEENIEKIMRIGRARWKIENETFNTLKNQGYHFEHNFGHGTMYLNQNFAMLMLLAFLIDQLSELCDALFQAALKAKKRKKYLWQDLVGLVSFFKLESWAEAWTSLAQGIDPQRPIFKASSA